MSNEMNQMLIEEYADAESVAEVVALTATNEERLGKMDDEVVAAQDAAVARLANQVEPPVNSNLEEVVKQLMAQLAEVKAAVAFAPKVVAQRPNRGGAKYKLLKTEVSWSTKPQVLAIVQILSAHMEVGEVRTEEEIVAMMVANEDVLATRQGGKRIWDYYKGEHNLGLVAHGNLEKV